MIKTCISVMVFCLFIFASHANAASFKLSGAVKGTFDFDGSVYSNVNITDGNTGQDFVDLTGDENSANGTDGGWELDLDFDPPGLPSATSVDYMVSPEFGMGLNYEGTLTVEEVPLPAAAWLFISAIGGLGVLKRIKK